MTGGAGGTAETRPAGQCQRSGDGQHEVLDRRGMTLKTKSLNRWTSAGGLSTNCNPGIPSPDTRCQPADPPQSAAQQKTWTIFNRALRELQELLLKGVIRRRKKRQVQRKDVSKPTISFASFSGLGVVAPNRKNLKAHQASYGIPAPLPRPSDRQQ